MDRRVLIPRPETEQVVEVALAELQRMMAERVTAGTANRVPLAVDLGTGSGAIALSLAVEGGSRLAASRSGPPIRPPVRSTWLAPT